MHNDGPPLELVGPTVSAARVRQATAQGPRPPQRLPSLALPERTTPLLLSLKDARTEFSPTSPQAGAPAGLFFYKLDDMGCDDARGCGDDGDDD